MRASLIPKLYQYPRSATLPRAQSALRNSMFISSLGRIFDWEIPEFFLISVGKMITLQVTVSPWCLPNLLRQRGQGYSWLSNKDITPFVTAFFKPTGLTSSEKNVDDRAVITCRWTECWRVSKRENLRSLRVLSQVSYWVNGDAIYCDVLLLFG